MNIQNVYNVFEIKTNFKIKFLKHLSNHLNQKEYHKNVSQIRYRLVETLCWRVRGVSLGQNSLSILKNNKPHQ